MHKVDPNDINFIQSKFRKKIIGATPCPINLDGKINPHVTRFHNADGSYTSVFHVKPVYYETLTGHWRPLSEITKYHGNRKIELNENWSLAHPRYIDWLAKRQRVLGGELLIPSSLTGSLEYYFAKHPIGLTTTTVYPDPSPETTTVDGTLYHDHEVGPFTNLATASTAEGINDSASAQSFAYVGHNQSNGRYWIYCSMFLFDTSSIGSDTIDSGTMSVYINAKASDDLSLTNKSIRLVSSSPASNTAIVVGDYDSYGTTALASDITVASISTGAYTDFTLNASGEGHIDGSGVTKFGGQHTAHAEDEAPISPSADDYNGINNMNFAEASGTSTDPKLAITHSAAAAAFTPKVMMY